MSEAPESARRCATHSLMGVRIAGTGSYLPDQVVTNEDLGRLGCDADWIVQRTGIRQRRHAPPEMATSDMAIAAGQRALEAAGGDADDVDLLILATFTPDYLLPQTATNVQDRLGLCCPAMDLVAACAGFAYGLVTGSQFIATGAARRVLVIGADTNSRVLDPDDKKTYPLFGDGAGAVVLEAGSPQQGLLAYTLGADGAGMRLLWRPMGGSREPYRCAPEGGKPWLMQMDGRPVFKWAVRLIEDSFSQVLDAAGRRQDQVRWWIMHQANTRILDAATQSMGLDPERVVMHLDRYGNTSAGSMPIALDETVRGGLIRPGDEVMLCGFGAGLSWGTALWKW